MKSEKEQKKLFKKYYESRAKKGEVEIKILKKKIIIKYNNHIVFSRPFDSFKDYIKLGIEQNRDEIKFLKSLLS